MSQADLLAEFDPLHISAVTLEPVPKGPLSPGPSPGLSNGDYDLIRRAQERQQAIVQPLHQAEKQHGGPQISQARPGSSPPPRRLSGIMKKRDEALARSPPAVEDFAPSRQRRRSNNSHPDYSDFVSAAASPEASSSPSTTQHTHSEPTTYSAETFSTALHTAMHSEIAQDWMHSAQTLSTSLRNNFTSRSSSTPTPSSSRPALAHLFSESTFSSPPAEKPKRAATYVSGAPGVNFSEQQNWNKGHWQSSPSDPPLPVQLLGSRMGARTILTSDLAEGLRPSLPTRLRIANQWTLLYSLDQHGVSLATLYEKTAQGMSGKGVSAGCVLVVQDNDGNIFGSFSNEALKKREGYYGSGECFLWKAEELADFRVGVGVKAYKWTGRNEYMVLCDNEFISFGGG